MTDPAEDRDEWLSTAADLLARLVRAQERRAEAAERIARVLEGAEAQVARVVDAQTQPAPKRRTKRRAHRVPEQPPVTELDRDARARKALRRMGEDV